ncbi:hypothetical protein F0562_032284 [Nyssa sinensis]|uniref:Uncharacterized protein n=1 Tax=Nyssa sinensis TaxID=561372 RepID=A0A5J5ATA6_9ASTE|nr:hypothetical protein F0562_032284 [Nyssa sinensis]
MVSRAPTMLSVHPPVHYNHRDLLVLMVSKVPMMLSIHPPVHYNHKVQAYKNRVQTDQFLTLLKMKINARREFRLPMRLFKEGNGNKKQLPVPLCSSLVVLKEIGGLRKRATSKSTGAQAIAKQLNVRSPLTHSAFSIGTSEVESAVKPSAHYKLQQGHPVRVIHLSSNQISDRGPQSLVISSIYNGLPAISQGAIVSRSNATQIGDWAPQRLVISNTGNGLPQVSQGTVPPVETKTAVHPVTFKSNEEKPQLILALSGVASTSQYESPAGVHVAVA